MDYVIVHNRFRPRAFRPLSNVPSFVWIVWESFFPAATTSASGVADTDVVEGKAVPPAAATTTTTPRNNLKCQQHKHQHKQLALTLVRKSFKVRFSLFCVDDENIKFDSFLFFLLLLACLKSIHLPSYNKVIVLSEVWVLHCCIYLKWLSSPLSIIKGDLLTFQSSETTINKYWSNNTCIFELLLQQRTLDNDRTSCGIFLSRFVTPHLLINEK